jgi:Immunoglobulin-like domain of bacterial spore germination
MLKIISVLIGITVVLGCLSLWFAPRAAAPVDVSPMPDVPATMCTMDAMQCADGSYVGRTGPHCEFVCPPSATSTVVSTSTTSDVIVTSPASDAVLGTTTAIAGTASGSWYFEGSFPIELVDASGTVLSQAVATAESDWMTASSVPFTSTLTFSNQDHLASGTLRFKKDNPSGLPENDGSFEVPVRFTP